MSSPRVAPATLPFVIAALMSATAPRAAAQLPVRAADAFVVEIEPLLFAESGASLALLRAFGADARWAAGLTVHATDLPDRVRDNFFDGADGLDLRLAWAVGFDVRRRLTGTRSGWLAGLGAGVEEFRAEIPDGPSDEQTNVFVAPHLGYVWYPGGGPVFVYPRATVIALIDDDRSRTVGSTEYELRSLAPNLQLRVGLRF